MKKFFVLCILSLALFACTPKPSPICVNHTDSLICQYIPDPLQADLVLRIANLEAIKNNVYTKQQALIAIDKIETAVNSTITYSDILILTNEYIKQLGPEIIVVTSTFDKLNQNIPISDYDKKLIIAHLERQKQVINLIN